MIHSIKQACPSEENFFLPAHVNINILLDVWQQTSIYWLPGVVSAADHINFLIADLFMFWWIKWDSIEI